MAVRVRDFVAHEQHFHTEHQKVNKCCALLLFQVTWKSLPRKENTLQDELLSRQEAAQTLGISLSKLDELRHSGHIKYGHIGSRVFIPRSEVNAFIDEVMRA